MFEKVDADYLIVGAGASGMAFADTLLSESSATIILVDKEHKPGGHWNHAYPFVTLHQPSAFYGVSSKELSRGVIDKVGLNQGLNELASGAQINAYYCDLMHEAFLPSGRVFYFPRCEHLGDGVIRSLVTGETIQLGYQKLVDATYYKTSIPATHTPAFHVDQGVNFIPPNKLPFLAAPIKGVTIIGGGKTAIDSCLWLLEHGVPANNIMWVMPRDGWFIDRKNTQPSADFFFDSIGAQAAQMEAIAESTSLADMFLRLEKAGVFLRLDSEVLPKMFHGATVSKKELQLIQQVKNVIRQGRVLSLHHDKMRFEETEVNIPEGQTIVDCTASAISNLEITSVFKDNTITLQTVRAYQPVFSASFIAHIELTYPNIDKKNNLCRVVVLPNHDYDWIELTYQNMMNQFFWSKEPGLKTWLQNNRLDGFMKMVASVKFYEFKKLAVLNRMRKAAKPAIGKLKMYKAELGS
ncbi:NAD(P)-binding protein [uncultured Paraglaciecola sp.]|uniref:NAD(P)-binding protein n=1 Tax=uncultured Paraglaciecola sp. TaxID=1765024 RepID=UPI00261E21F5|nr:NAD(P)-binding protein [uncultured Paraglaciecola sp.]